MLSVFETPAELSDSFLKLLPIVIKKMIKKKDSLTLPSCNIHPQKGEGVAASCSNKCGDCYGNIKMSQLGGFMIKNLREGSFSQRRHRKFCFLKALLNYIATSW